MVVPIVFVPITPMTCTRVGACVHGKDQSGRAPWAWRSGTVNLHSTLVNLHTLGNLVLTNALISITRAKVKKRRGEEGRGEEGRVGRRRG